MASEEQRISDLEEKATQQEAASITLVGVVQTINTKVDGLAGTARSIQAHELVVDSRLGTIDNRLNAQRVQIDNMQLDIQRSFGQVAATMATKDDLATMGTQLNERLTTIDEANDEHNDDLIRWRNEVIEHVNKTEAALNAKLDHLIELLTKQGE